ncbi:MAG: Wzz/FepE/Etk N-terminal domain-containing protein [candidate division KSB1 bacterium]|nr:Wzz/FepE/Etk N-terminal domain-containing protein [candidate division KSB1 bacterium]MDZ7301684.1 Wzz/FepE/Etk N-terminal domain-containing protein [candidate division KSB1 bacterium]MDZ7312429.1 Wzz/FepE/Etk N-terminal domain-containing protein [candidate division KSB1 bacterium]
MEKQEYRVLSLAEIIDILKRRKMTFLLSVVLAIIPVLLYNHFATPIYQATAIVAFEDYSKEATVGFDFAGSLYRGNFVANRIQEMKTKTFARQVYDELPDSVRAWFRLPEPLPSKFNSARHVVGIIRSNLSVQLIKTTDLVTITYAAESPELAKTVANAVTTVLQKSNLRVRRQEYTSLREFIDEQIRVVQERLQQAEEALRDFKASENITSLEDESKEVLQRITQAEVLFNQIQTDKDARQRRLAVIRKKLDEEKQELSSSVTQITSPVIVKLKEKLVELEVRYSGLQVQNYPENHPKMIELKTEITQTRENLIQATKQIFEGEKLKGVIDPLSQLQKYLEESILLEVELQALSAQEAHLQKILDNYSGYLKKLPDKELSLVRLMRDKEVNNKIYTRLLEEREQARIREAAEIGNIRVVEPAEASRVPARPQKMLNLIIGLFTGTVIGLLLIFVKEFVKEAPRTPEEIERILSLPVLASVPQIKRGLAFDLNGRHRQRALVNHAAAAPFTRDAFSYLWSSLPFSEPRGTLVVMITSTGPGEGKSTVAANLAVTGGRHGKKTILIDGDLRKPVLHEMFGLAPSPGLTNIVVEATQAGSTRVLNAALAEFGTELHGETLSESSPRNVREALVHSIHAALQLTSDENLRILVMGDPIIDPDLLWSSPMIEETLTILRQVAELIVIDTPPIIGMPDASIIAHHCDGIILCVEAGQTEKKILLRAQKILQQTGSKFWGVVLNKVDPNSIYGTYKYYKYYVKHYHKAGRRSPQQS